jgi:hypothetical protein
MLVKLLSLTYVMIQRKTTGREDLQAILARKMGQRKD